ncbi:MAG: DMT family transporter, partial [Gemmobacter sp.]
LGLVGVLIVLSPRITIGAEVSDRELLGVTLVLGGAVFAALAQVFVRKLVSTERTATIVFWFSITASALSLLTLPFGWAWPAPIDATLLVTAGLLGGVGQILLTASYREADASVVAPFEYVSIIFALAIGYAVFDEVPTLAMLGGAALVVAAGIIIIWREHRLGLERARQRKAMTPQG